MNDKFGYQQSNEQWYFRFSDGRVVRAKLASCARCGIAFPTYRSGKYCGKKCSGPAVADARSWPEQRPKQVHPRVPRIFTQEELDRIKQLHGQHQGIIMIARELKTRAQTIITLQREMHLPPLMARNTKQRLMTRYERSDGYVMIWSNSKWRKEHRVIMEQMIGRPLLSHENIHHKNAIRNDNRPENLELWQTSQPSGRRATESHCATCACFP